MSTRPFLTFVAGVAVALAIPALGQTVQSYFPDVSANASYSGDIDRMANIGIIRGYDNGRFGPNDYVTRAQVAVMFNRYDQTVVQPLRDQIAVIASQMGVNACGGHAVGDSYPSADGCNSCSCTKNGEICTLRACNTSSRSSASSISSRRSVSSAAATCGNKICEAGEANYCPSQNCAPGEVCAQYCMAGSCMRDCMSSSSSSSTSSTNQCAPYVCNDGTRIPACTVDGHVINYFAPPCMSHGGEAQ